MIKREAISHYYVRFANPMSYDDWRRTVSEFRRYIASQGIILDDFGDCCDLCSQWQSNQTSLDCMEGFIRGDIARWEPLFVAYFARKQIGICEVRD